jgi:hypothetical protein
MPLSAIDYDTKQSKEACVEAGRSGSGRSVDLDIKVEMQVSELTFSVSILLTTQAANTGGKKSSRSVNRALKMVDHREVAKREETRDTE